MKTKLLLLLSCALISTGLYAKPFKDDSIKLVTTTKDHGKGSLRQAILDANARDMLTRIKFKLSKKDSNYDKCTQSWTITPHKELPVITSEVYIDGYSQKGAEPNCNPINQKNTARICVELCGSKLKNSLSTTADLGPAGLIFGPGSEGSAVKGLAVNNFPVGIEVAANNIKIGGNFLGVAVNGSKSKANLVSILVTESAQGTQIGDGNPRHRNLISGLGQIPKNSELSKYDTLGAITNFGQNTTIQGSTVNITRCGDKAILDHAYVGIVSTLTTGTTIGGPNFSDRVVVAGHKFANILFDTTGGDTVCNTLVGTDITGTKGIGGLNGLVFLNRFAQPPAGETNETGHLVKESLFSGHKKCGIFVGQENDPDPVSDLILKNIKVGTDITGKKPIPNGEHGICLNASIGTQIINTLSRFNEISGIRIKLESNGVDIFYIDTRDNKVRGVQLDGAEQKNGFDGQSINTRITGNGNNAITTPCFTVKGFPENIPNDLKLR